jgi:hypothetical protein
MGFTNLGWLFRVLIILHNAEEAIWLRAWAPRTGFWRNAVSPVAFGFAAAGLTVLGLAVTWMSGRSGSQRLWTYLTFGYMAANVKQRCISSPRDIDCNAELYAGRSDGHRPEPASIISALASALVEGRVSGWRPVRLRRGRVRSACLDPGAVQVGKGPESLNERNEGPCKRHPRFRNPNGSRTAHSDPDGCVERFMWAASGWITC